MISGIFHEGSGVGNQLHRYVMTRVLATDKGSKFGMQDPQNFKCKGWMKADLGIEVSKHHTLHPFREKEIRDQNGVDIRSYDPEVNFIEDNTIIDGEFQDPRYFEHRLDEIREWLEVEPLEMDDDVCVIGFRGGEYTVFPELFLPKSYWDRAIGRVLVANPNTKFEVHTDDPEKAKEFFPDFEIISDVALNWRSVRYAKNLIIANSSFYILPALLNENADKIYAPRYWARHNTRTWALPQNYYKEFKYI
jgi:hypothetical protein